MCRRFSIKTQPSVEIFSKRHKGRGQIDDKPFKTAYTARRFGAEALNSLSA
jgi:hypothetical protein